MKIVPRNKSDQWNSDDFIAGPKTFTIAGVKENPPSAQSQFDIDLVEGQGKVWRPPNTVVKILVAAWGDDDENWIGRRVTLYRDEEVRFGGEVVTGIRVSHMSDIPKPIVVRLISTRGKRATHEINPLVGDPPVDVQGFEERIAAATTAEQLNVIAKDLKAQNLGEHRTHLIEVWGKRKAAIGGAE